MVYTIVPVNIVLESPSPGVGRVRYLRQMNSGSWSRTRRFIPPLARTSAGVLGRKMCLEQSDRRVMCAIRNAMSAVSGFVYRSAAQIPCKSAIRLDMGWCPGKDSNLHGLHHWYLKPARLPIPPPGQRATHRGSAFALSTGRMAPIPLKKRRSGASDRSRADRWRNRPSGPRRARQRASCRAA